MPASAPQRATQEWKRHVHKTNLCCPHVTDRAGDGHLTINGDVTVVGPGDFAGFPTDGAMHFVDDADVTAVRPEGFAARKGDGQP